MCIVLGILYGSQEENIRIGQALALGFLNPPFIMHFVAREHLTKSLLVKSQGLKDLHQRLSLLTEISLPDSWTPPFSTASTAPEPLLAYFYSPECKTFSFLPRVPPCPAPSPV